MKLSVSWKLKFQLFCCCSFSVFPDGNHFADLLKWPTQSQVCCSDSGVLAGLCSWEGVVRPSRLSVRSSACPNMSNRSSRHPHSKPVCVAVSSSSSLRPPTPSRLSPSLRAPQRAATTRKRRSWKVGKVLVQLSPSLHARVSVFRHIWSNQTFWSTHFLSGDKII